MQMWRLTLSQPKFPAHSLRIRARSNAALLAPAFALALSACSSLPVVQEPPLSAPTSPVTSNPLPGGPPVAGQLGTGPVRVALILPLTQAGGPSVIGASLRNGAELALQESGGNDISILVKDDGSTAEGAKAAAQAAVGEGAELIVGPLFGANVLEVGRIAKASGRPVIGFSTDTTTAARGVYLLSFLVENEVDRVVDFAAARGKKSFAALVPESQYGNVALAAFQQAAARRNIRVQSIERYPAGGAAAAAAKIGALGEQIDALFLPEQADAVGGVAKALVSGGVNTGKVQLIGTGVWNDARVMKSAEMQGAWFAAPENTGFTAFAGRYRAKFGSDPTRLATLSYDAVSLVAALARTQGAQRFSETVLTNASGFNGADGVFRFRPDGPNERGLSVLQISGGTTKAVSPAPHSFAAAATAAR